MKFKTECKHYTKSVSRMRGTRVRYHCNECGLLGKWVKSEPAIATKQMDDVQSSESNGTPTDLKVVDYPEATVVELRAMCKEKGITGYSKMKRDALVFVLANSE